ncbi:NUDIX hydrolase [Nocardioides bruguierae]|uniref:NUDIX hydrolase n=1 Tax=Nocardioides bruguierae TaxID=2945102 RepID=UPI0027E1C153|nr:NUDIX domain-containing protein [Nocardioides bruguierae]
MEPIILAAVAFVRDGRLLTVRKAGTTMFLLPGGKLEPGETPLEAARREVSEEVALDVAAADLRLLGEFAAPAANEPGRSVVSTVYAADLPGEPVRSGEIAELRWSSLATPEDDLAPLLRDHVVPALTVSPSPAAGS